MRPYGSARIEVPLRTIPGVHGDRVGRCARPAIGIARQTVTTVENYANTNTATEWTIGQYDAAKEITAESSKAYTTLHFTGHSLGGGLAMAMAAKTKHYSAYTVFNSAGLHATTVGRAEEFAKLTATTTTAVSTGA